MEVTLKGGPDICRGDSVVEGEKRIKGDDDKEKTGSKKPSLDDSNLKPSSSNQKDSGTGAKVSTMITVDKSPSDGNPRPPSSGQKDPTMQEDWLESTKTEMGEVREENKRLKMSLARIVKDYESLQMQFYNNVQEEQAKKSANKKSVTEDTEERDLISLSLGTSSTWKKKDDKITKSSEDEVDEQVREALSLRFHSRLEELDCGRQLKPSLNLSPQNSTEGSKKEESGEAWQQPTRSPQAVGNGDDEVSHPPPAKKARVSVRARCDTPTMNDGCQWRKYGQKIAKGNPCPRAYYRCTVSPGCPVKKQVQRCAEDMSILITTYEGTHNHPLPVSATAMASTTSAAASMLVSGSSTSQTHETLFPVGSTTNFHGLNLSFSDNSRSKQFYQSNPSTLLSSAYHPTITLDLTSPPPHFSSLSSNLPSAIPRYAPTGFGFSSSESTTLPTSWSNGYLNVGTQTYKPTPVVPSLGGASQEHVYQSCFQKSNSPPPQQLLTDASIADATKAITSDPNFRSALMVAITSILSGAQGNQVGREDSGLNLKWGETFPPKTIPRENGCAPTYFK